MRDTPATWEKEYQSGQTPWDSGITPPEVVKFWSSRRLPAQGAALDLGCGTATNVAYLANLGLRRSGSNMRLPRSCVGSSDCVDEI